MGRDAQPGFEPERDGRASGSSIWVIRLAAVVVALEGLALAAFAVLDLASVTSGRVALGIGTSMFFCVYAGGQLAAAYGLARLRGWSRGPVLFTQLIQLGLAWNLRGADLSALSPVLAVAAVVVLVGVLSPASLRTFAAADDAG